jgi:hypothetical protein
MMQMGEESKDENKEEEHVIQSLAELDCDLKSTSAYLEDVLTDAFATIQLHRSHFAKKALSLVQKNRSLFRDIVPRLFELSHLRMHRPSDVKGITDLELSVGRIWGYFLFPLETSNMDARVRDIFVDCAPYFCTQCCHHLFVAMTRGEFETTSRSFRMKLCGTIVRIFTSIAPLESLLQSKLSYYFTRPPQVDIIGTAQKAKKDEVRTLLPSENLD